MSSKKRQKLIFSLVIFIFSIFAVIFSEGSSVFSKPFEVSNKPKEEVKSGAIISENIEENYDITSENIETEEVPIDDPEQRINTLYRVLRVVDGDTIDVLIDEKTYRLRLIGMNTPETVDPRTKVECFGKEASNKAKELLSDNFVSLESDDSQGERDKYGRLLRYVFLSDGTNFNKFMIENGFAYEYTYDLPYKYQNDFKNAQSYAMQNELGLWSNLTCSGNK